MTYTEINETNPNEIFILASYDIDKATGVKSINNSDALEEGTVLRTTGKKRELTGAPASNELILSMMTD